MPIKKRNSKTCRRKTCRRKTCRRKDTRLKFGGISLPPPSPPPVIVLATVRQPDGSSFQVIDDFDFNIVRPRILRHRDNRYRQQIENGSHFIYRGPGVASLPGQPPNPYYYEIMELTGDMRMWLQHIRGLA